MSKKKQFQDLEQSRYGLFMNENSFNLEIAYGRNYLVTDSVHEVLVYKINIIETKSHDLYGQTKPRDKKFFPPIKIRVMPLVEDAENKIYGEDKGIVRNDTGKLIIGIYLDELKEKNLEILRGDILMYNMSGEKNRYYEVEDAQNVVDETNMTLGGYKSYYKIVKSNPVKEDFVPFINEIEGNF